MNFVGSLGLSVTFVDSGDSQRLGEFVLGTTRAVSRRERLRSSPSERRDAGGRGGMVAARGTGANDERCASSSRRAERERLARHLAVRWRVTARGASDAASSRRHGAARRGQ